MLGPPKLRCLDRPITVSLEDLIPADNFYRHLDAKLDLTFVRDWAQDCYAEFGRPSIDPIIFFKLQLIMFFEGIRSERRLMDTVALNLAHRWYLGYALDEPLPDHSSLTRIRDRLGVEFFQRFFEHIVDLCQQAGLVWGKELIFDATKVRANADIDSLVPRWYQQARSHVQGLFADEITPPSPNESEETPASAPTLLPVAIDAEARTRLVAEEQATWKLLQERRLDPNRPQSSGYQRQSDLFVSTTDPDATPMRHNGHTSLGYHDHYVVDGGKARIIVAALVTPADVMENAPMRDLLWRVRFRWHLHPKLAVCDATYGTVDNIRALEDAGIRVYVPLANWDRTPYYGPSRFLYDAARDEYHCPQGQALRRHTVKSAAEVVVYRAATVACKACPVKPACTVSEHGRTIKRSFYAEYLERVEAYHKTSAYQMSTIS